MGIFTYRIDISSVPFPKMGISILCIRITDFAVQVQYCEVV